jgi:hypothetical protein
MHMTPKEEQADYTDGDAELSGFLTWDGNELPHPGVLVVHGGAGLDEHAKRRARQLAQLGAQVFACDMYGKALIGDHVPTAQLTGRIEEMNAAEADFQLIVYGGAMDGFTHDIGPQAPGVAYHALRPALVPSHQVLPRRSLCTMTPTVIRRAAPARPPSSAGPLPHGHRHPPGCSRTATVIRVSTQSLPSSSVISTSQTQVVRPR